MAKPRSPPPANTLNALGVYLRTRLKQHGRSLAALSRSSGLSRQTLHAATRAGHQRLPAWKPSSASRSTWVSTRCT
jgi:hypothetical protein